MLAYWILQVTKVHQAVIRPTHLVRVEISTLVVHRTKHTINKDMVDQDILHQVQVDLCILLIRIPVQLVELHQRSQGTLLRVQVHTKAKGGRVNSHRHRLLGQVVPILDLMIDTAWDRHHQALGELGMPLRVHRLTILDTQGECLAIHQRQEPQGILRQMAILARIITIPNLLQMNRYTKTLATKLSTATAATGL